MTHLYTIVDRAVGRPPVIEGISGLWLTYGDVREREDS